MAELPTGTVTFLYTDIEGSTALWEAHTQVMPAAVERHDALLRQAIAAHRGHVFRTAGDGLCAAFATAPDAVAAALAAQRALSAEDWGAISPMRVRIALHTGAAEVRDGDYVGAALNRIGRLLAAGYGGQVLLSQTTADLVRGALPAGTSLRDMGEHRLRDLVEPERVYQLLHPDLPTHFPPLRSLDAYPHNLPLQLTSFVGREREMAAVKEMLGQTRLLTLTGTGGCGKTRLALEVAGQVVDEYPAGSWLVELAPLADPTLVPQTVASVLGVTEQPGQPITTTIIAALRPKRLLLVLDNCEHVIQASAVLVEALLAGCPGLRILATSRELLGVAGETAWRIPSLAIPDPQHLPPPEQLVGYEAVRLFIERARLLQPSFAVTDQNAVAVVQICARLDGIPLALELAAARVTALTVEQLAARLHDRFRLLTGGRRTALRRQQTLRAAVDWSHDLLSEAEQVLLRRLAVFAGGWTLEAAEAVCTAEGVETWEILDLLTQLVQKSLVVAEEQAGEERYRLLETIRQYAEEKLLAAGEAAAVRERHAAWYLTLAEQMVPTLYGPEVATGLNRLEADSGNLRAALEWYLAAPDGAEPSLRLATALARFWHLHDYLSEGRSWLERALARGTEASSAVRVAAQEWVSHLAIQMGDLEPVVRWREEALATYRELGDQAGIAGSLSSLGFVARERGDYATARGLLEESLAVARSTGEPSLIAAALFARGQLAYDEGDDATARAVLEESVRVYRRLGDPRLGGALSWLGRVLAQQGEYRAARAVLEESLALKQAAGMRRSSAFSLMMLGLLAQREGNVTEAHEQYLAALRFQQETGAHLDVLRTLYGLAGVSASRGQGERAGRLLGAVAALGLVVPPSERADRDQAVAVARDVLGDAAFEVAYAAGQALTLEEAVAEALAEVGDG